MEHIDDSKSSHENVENVDKTGTQVIATKKQRQTAVSQTPVTGTAQKGPGTPRSRSHKASRGPSGSQRSPRSPPSASCGHQRSVTASRTFDQIQAEHLYLFSNLQQQEARMRTLVAALATVQSQLQLPSTAAEARRLRKNAGFIKSKIAHAEQQERLALLGLGHVSAELQSRFRHLQLEQHLHQQQQHILAAHAPPPAQGAHLYGPIQGETHCQMQPQTPYLVPLNGPALFLPGSYEEAYGTGMTATTPSSPSSWQDRSRGGMAMSVSPMSPLAPVFQPGASFFGHTGANDDICSTMADAADDAADRQASLGGTPITGEAYEKAGEKDEKTVDSTPRSAPQPGEATTTMQPSLKCGAETGVAGMHYVFDTDETGDIGGNGDSDDFESMPRKIRLRRGSHDGKPQQQQKPSTPVREKRMSLPPVRFSWP